jgi:type IV secretory pathway VirB9-like protein
LKVRAVIYLVLFLASSLGPAFAQSPIAAMTLGPDQIGKIRTAPGITTRITFTEPVQDIICGDLYDASSGRGTFVVQRGGTAERPSNDVFIKPIAPKGVSNLFVKIGENGKYTYNFDLEVVSLPQAHRVVNVSWAATTQPTQSATDPPPAATNNPAQPPGSDPSAATAEAEKRRSDILIQARQEADEIKRKAQQQADRIVTEAETKGSDLDRQTATRSEQVLEDKFVQALMLGLREIKINNPRVAVKKIIVALDPRVLTFDDKSYVRYTITNSGDKPFAYSSISLEIGSGSQSHPVTVKVVQSKNENTLDPGESLSGVIAFDAKAVTAKDRLALYVRGEDSAEIAHVNIQE